MKTLGLFSFAIIAVFGLSQPVQADAADRSEGYYFPNESTYDSCGRKLTVRHVQLALEEDGYYVGDNRGNFGFETRAAVRRYQRDNGLRISGKIDDSLLRTLRLR
ncbi:MAG TPA: peptidoglycan-binding domain-containing protein [Chthoniobacterales bacterium]|nr:peptidoglycan-binding domain-containing protein [Chthoniobacterales bacterium]